MAFVRGRENYDRLVSEASEAPYILDASTAYLPSVNAAENIAVTTRSKDHCESSKSSDQGLQSL